MRNGVDGDARTFPQLVHDRVYEVLNPGDPVEQVLRFPEIFIFPANGVFTGIQTAGPNVHMRLLDREAHLIGEGVAGNEGETLSLSAANAGELYGVEIAAKNTIADPQHLALKWNLAEAKRSAATLSRTLAQRSVGTTRMSSLIGNGSKAGLFPAVFPMGKVMTLLRRMIRDQRTEARIFLPAKLKGRRVGFSKTFRLTKSGEMRLITAASPPTFPGFSAAIARRRIAQW